MALKRASAITVPRDGSLGTTDPATTIFPSGWTATAFATADPPSGRDRNPSRAKPGVSCAVRVQAFDEHPGTTAGDDDLAVGLDRDRATGAARSGDLSTAAERRIGLAGGGHPLDECRAARLARGDDAAVPLDRDAEQLRAATERDDTAGEAGVQCAGSSGPRNATRAEHQRRGQGGQRRQPSAAGARLPRSAIHDGPDSTIQGLNVRPLEILTTLWVEIEVTETTSTTFTFFLCLARVLLTPRLSLSVNVLEPACLSVTLPPAIVVAR